MPAKPQQGHTGDEARGGLRIPDLCAARSVLFLGLISVLLALLLVLYAHGLRPFAWGALGRAGGLILWNVLLSAALLCALRGALARMRLPVGALLAWLLVMTVCLVTHLAQHWLFGALLDGLGAWPSASLLGRDLLICALLAGAALRYFHLQGELIEHERAELDARLQALQARIRPHFLFNSMNIIASLIGADPEQAERAVEDLAELFRASLREGEPTVPLATELELCERYLRLEQWRLGERLRVERDIPPHGLEGARVPLLSVQPLIENAVYHGIQQLPEGGTLRLVVRAEGARLRIAISNPVPAVRTHRGSGIALDNIRARLAAIYGAEVALRVRESTGTWHAELDLPHTARA